MLFTAPFKKRIHQLSLEMGTYEVLEIKRVRQQIRLINSVECSSAITEVASLIHQLLFLYPVGFL